MRNPFMAKNWTLGKFFLVLWILFSVVFVVMTLWTNVLQRTYNYGMQQGSQQGVQAAVVDIMKKVSSKCEAVPLTIGDQRVDILNVACLQNPNAEKPAEESAE